MDSIVQSIVTALSGKISKELIVFLVSMVPLLELRGKKVNAFTKFPIGLKRKHFQNRLKSKNTAISAYSFL